MTTMRTDGIGNQTRVNSSWQRLKGLALPAIAGSIAGFVGGVIAQPTLHSYFERRSMADRTFETCVDGKPKEVKPQEIQFTCYTDKDWKFVGLQHVNYGITFMGNRGKAIDSDVSKRRGVNTTSYSINGETMKIEWGMDGRCMSAKPGDDHYALARDIFLRTAIHYREFARSIECFKALDQVIFALQK